MSQEIEMKLALARESAERLCRHPLLQRLPADTRRLANTYYDTAEGTLESRGMALRLRYQEGHWIQTLKTSGVGSGGLSQRGEWEWPVAGEALDRERLAALPPMAELGPDLLARLEPRFTTDFERRRWQLELAEAHIEVALDQGEIRAAGRQVPIRELELELKHGDAEALWSLARAFAETLALRPADASKALRGSALLTGQWTLPDGTLAGERLHRALLALDAYADTGEDGWKAHARATLQVLEADGHPEAGRLAALLEEPDWLGVDFGRTALQLAQRLAS
ncbi:CYTH domain-containing protein [Halomonas sp. E14]|uniref:CYTH domain-containing protein n=1 Tax=Halomonas sp. E14 TaxID=3397245 RepID=UPI00403E93FD